MGVTHIVAVIVVSGSAGDRRRAYRLPAVLTKAYRARCVSGSRSIPRQIHTFVLICPTKQHRKRDHAS